MIVDKIYKQIMISWGEAQERYHHVYPKIIQNFRLEATRHGPAGQVFRPVGLPCVALMINLYECS